MSPFAKYYYYNDILYSRCRRDFYVYQLMTRLLYAQHRAQEGGQGEPAAGARRAGVRDSTRVRPRRRGHIAAGAAACRHRLGWQKHRRALIRNVFCVF